LKAVLSLERSDIDYAAHILGAVDAFAAQLLPAEGAVASIGKWISGKSETEVSNAELRLRVMRAEANLLLGLMQLLQESYISYIKAGFNLRAAWKGYEATQRIVAAAGSSAATRFDKNVLSGVLFGIGGVNLAVSQLPTKVLKLVSIFGIPHDRHEGFRSLRASAASGGFRAPLANLIMCGYYALIPSFAPCLVDSYLRQGLPLLQGQLDLYPVSAIHWWLGGRMLRLRRDPQSAIAAFRRSAAGGREFQQVLHVNAYEIGVSRMALGDWRVASDHFGLLFAQSTWSRAMYRYMQAACAEALGHRERAVSLAKQVPSLVDRTYGGRVLSVEQFVVRRVKGFEARGWTDLFFMAVELVYMWNLFPQTSLRSLVIVLNAVRRSTEEAQLFGASGSKLPALLYRVGDELRHGRHPTIPGVDRRGARRFFAALTARYPNSTAGAQAYEALAQLDEEERAAGSAEHPPDGAEAEAASVADMRDEPGTTEELTARLRSALDEATTSPATVPGAGAPPLLRPNPLLYITEAEARSLSSHTLLARWDTPASVQTSASDASSLIERLAIAWAIEASILSQLGEEAAAASLYERLGRVEKAKVVREEKHIFPFATLDRATYAYAAGRRDEALRLARHVYSSYSDYNFEYRLLLRCHLLIRHMEDNVDGEE
jgi:tetratricopeptide (TPR) repeat protein